MITADKLNCKKKQKQGPISSSMATLKQEQISYKQYNSKVYAYFQYMQGQFP